jgi:hypothetical protein
MSVLFVWDSRHTGAYQYLGTTPALAAYCHLGYEFPGA